MPPKSNPGVRTLEFEPQGSNTSSFAGSNPEVRGSRFEKKTGFGRSPTRALRIWSQMLRDSTRTASLVRFVFDPLFEPRFEPHGSRFEVRKNDQNDPPQITHDTTRHGAAAHETHGTQVWAVTSCGVRFAQNSNLHIYLATPRVCSAQIRTQLDESCS
jgi:hypothetical protein